jgi:uncharacterized YigZ family protein
MYCVDQISSYTYEVKQSKFIAYLLPYDKYTQTLLELKEQHPKARHFVVAYRYFNEHQQIVEHSSDDGEPKGTSGKPSLFVLQGAEMIETAVIIVRYFGGTKLGTGGLVRAYSESVNAVLNDAILLEYKQEIKKQIIFEYTSVRLVEYECEVNNITIVQKEFDKEVLYTLQANESDMDTFLQSTQRLVRVI